MVWAKRIGKWLGLGLLALLTAGAIYQQIGLALDAKLAPPPGEMVAVNGHKMHLVCRGEGPRSFVMDAGAGVGAFEWWRVQPLLAATGRVCAFDRQGLGWSEVTGAGHDGATEADRLAALVRVAKIRTPFVYVGHSLGANFAMIYAARHPKDVAALVLLEPGMPNDLLEDFHGTHAEAMTVTDCGWLCYAAGAATEVGITRLAGALAIHAGRNLSGPPLDQYRAQLGRASSNMALAASLNVLPKTAYQDLDVKSFGATPVLILASSEPRPPEGNETVADVVKWRIVQRAWFASLAKNSAHGESSEVPNSTHPGMVMGAAQSAALARMIGDFLSRAGL